MPVQNTNCRFWKFCKLFKIKKKPLLVLLSQYCYCYVTEKKKIRPESVDCTPPDFIMPDNKDRPLSALQPQQKEFKVPQCVKVRLMLFIKNVYLLI